MDTAVRRIENILKSEYTTANYVELVKELFDTITFVAPHKFHSSVNTEDNIFAGYIHIGDYLTPDSKKMSIFSVKLKSTAIVENSRSAQRNYARKLIESGNSDAALIAFYAADDTKWRISFVRLDYNMKFENGKFSKIAKLTPAKRYSFLVGKEEPCHTAITRFFGLIVDKNYNPSLDEIEEVFSVERVTKEFFMLYSEKFYQLQDYLAQNADFKAESVRCGFSSDQFAKKLLGQIVFLYFLQKKGWLGVNAWPESLSDEEYSSILSSEGNSSRGTMLRDNLPKLYKQYGDKYIFLREMLGSLPKEVEIFLADHMPHEKTWGDGPSNFLRRSFDYSKAIGKPFYDYTLKTILYDALNRYRGGISYCPELHCRIPFLSGELFEPIENYDWRNTHFDIPDELFSNIENGDIDNADGILDIFDRYNFTICEEEPLECEVAIDPEMLGKVFENLLEAKERKSMGAFYTPREIVHYMCREGLINYLSNKVNVSTSDIRDFVLYGDFMKDEDTDSKKRVENGGLWVSEKLFDIDSNNAIITNRLIEVDNALSSVRVLDPAVGSGAFPLCMVNEIVRLRQIITAYLEIGMDEDERKAFLITNRRTPYSLKYDAIKNCIYAVDNEPSAVDIARLRLWLSLVIDAEIKPVATAPLFGSANPPALPSLESNILCSDSLVNRCAGRSPFCDGDIISDNVSSISRKMRSPEFLGLLKGLIAEQGKLFECESSIKKDELKKNIIAYKVEILRRFCKDHEFIETYLHTQQLQIKPFTLWQIDFAKVFLENGGFDIVIANPPYIQLQRAINEGSSEKIGDKYSDLGYSSFVKSGDMYCLFLELGVCLLKEDGHLVYITSNKWLRTNYGTKLRTYFSNHTNPKVIIDFAGTRVFETAGVDVSILLLQKAVNKGLTKVCTIKEPCGKSLDKYILTNSMEKAFLSGDAWIITPELEEGIKAKILKVGKPIADWNLSIKYGIKTCLNKVYIIDELMKERLCSEDPSSAEILSPVLQGKDINKWECNYRNRWLVAVHNGIHKYHIPPVDIDKYPAVKKYLTLHIDELRKKNSYDQGVTPYHLKNCTYYEEYSLPKIVFQEIEQSPAFALDSEGKYMCVDTVRIITGKHLEYLTALLNSNLFFFAVKHFFGGGALGESGVRMKHTFFKAFTAYVPTSSEEQYIKEIVLSKQQDRDMLINDFFYKKYGITTEEIQYIESDIKKVTK